MKRPILFVLILGAMLCCSSQKISSQEQPRKEDQVAFIHDIVAATTVNRVKEAHRRFRRHFGDDYAVEVIYCTCLYRLEPSIATKRMMIRMIPLSEADYLTLYAEYTAGDRDPAVGEVVDQYFSVIGALVSERGEGITAFLKMCCLSDGEVADTLSGWIEGIRRDWHREFAEGLQSLDRECRERLQ